MVIGRILLIVVAIFIANAIVGYSKLSNWYMIPVSIVVWIVLFVLLWVVEVALQILVPLLLTLALGLYLWAMIKKNKPKT